MRDVVCPHCDQTVAVPDGLTHAFCVRCGKAIPQLETHVTDGVVRAGSNAIESASRRRRHADESWEDFRASSPAVQRELMQLAARPLPDLRDVEMVRPLKEMKHTLDNWGSPLGSIQITGGGSPLLRRIVSLSFMGLSLLIFVAAAIIVLVSGDPGAWSLGIYGVMGVIAALIIWPMQKSSLTTTLWIFEDGVYVHRYGQSKAVAWENLQDFEVSMGTGRPLYWLTVTHDLSITISAGFSPDVIPLMEYIEIRLAAAQFLRRLEPIWEGRSQRFGDVTLSRKGLHTPKFFVPWPEVRKVVSDAQNLFIDWSGSPEWLPIRLRDVSFPYLVMAVSHVLIEEHSRFPRGGSGDV